MDDVLYLAIEVRKSVGYGQNKHDIVYGIVLPYKRDDHDFCDVRGVRDLAMEPVSHVKIVYDGNNRDLANNKISGLLRLERLLEDLG